MICFLKYLNEKIITVIAGEDWVGYVEYYGGCGFYGYRLGGYLGKKCLEFFFIKNYKKLERNL